MRLCMYFRTPPARATAPKALLPEPVAGAQGRYAGEASVSHPLDLVGRKCLQRASALSLNRLQGPFPQRSAVSGTPPTQKSSRSYHWLESRQNPGCGAAPEPLQAACRWQKPSKLVSLLSLPQGSSGGLAKGLRFSWQFDRAKRGKFGGLCPLPSASSGRAGSPFIVSRACLTPSPELGLLAPLQVAVS